MSKKILKGKVVSTKMAKTLVVNVPRLKQHKKYKKWFTENKRYKVHYDEGEYKVGDDVIIIESKPISKEKKWVVANQADESLAKVEKEEVKHDSSTNNS